MIPVDDSKTRIFLIGSSQTREDYDVEYLNRVFGKDGIEFYNLGISGGAQPIELFMIGGKILEKKPDLIIHTSYVGSFFGKYNFLKLKYNYDPVILPHLMRYTSYPKMLALKNAFLDSYLSRMSTLYKYRYSLQRIIRTMVKDWLAPGRRTQPTTYWYTEDKPVSYFREQVEKIDGKKYRRSRQVEMNEELFALFAEGVVSSGTEFIVISGPTHPMFRDCFSEEIDLEYNHYMSDQAERLGFTLLTEDQLPAFQENDFIDFTHLNASGRARLSRFVGEYLLERKEIVSRAR